MPTKYDGLLDYGRPEEINFHSRSKSWSDSLTSSWSPRRTSRWNFDLVRPEFMNRQTAPSDRPPRRTAWLDGLRGFAALLVCWHHHQLWAHNADGLNGMYENAFGFEDKRAFVALPFVRIFFSGGHYAVSVFFVISGYVLSVKALGLIQNGDFAKVSDTIGSSLFRRWLRLYLPVIAMTFLWITQYHTTKLWTPMGKPAGSFWDEVQWWYVSFKNYSFLFLTGDIYEFPVQYHAHVWSIPIEFKGSIIIYTALSALSRCTTHARLWCQVGLIFYFLYIVDGWYGALFMSGMMLSDLDLLSLEGQLPRIFHRLESFKELIFFHLFIASLYLGGVPSYDWQPHVLDQSPGWRWLSKLKPQAVFDDKWFYLFWAAFLLVASMPRLPFLKRFFETPFNQYLGRISFALYLVHGPVIWLLGDRMYAATGWVRDEHKEHIPQWVNAFPLSKGGVMGLELAFLVPALILIPVTLYVAEVVTKLFDEPSVRISSWLYRKTLAPHAKA
jgi:peptidoglycan/LPS O-acetylase OafA/YrhL